MNDNLLNEREDEVLTLYYYDDGLTEDERRTVQQRLESDAGFRARYEALERTLDAVGSLDSYTTTNDRKARFAARIDALADAANARTSASASATDRDRTSPVFGNWLIGFAVAASLAIGVAIGINFSESPAPVNDLVANSPPGADTVRPLALRVTSHLRDSQQRLLTASDESERDRMLLIRDIVTRNRAYIEQAEGQDDEKLARILRAMEPILLELAAEGTIPEDEAALNAQLLFELNVVLTKYGQDTSKEAGTT